MDNAVFYNQGSMMKLINLLEKPEKDQYFQSPKWTFEHQKGNYLGHVFSAFKDV